MNVFSSVLSAASACALLSLELQPVAGLARQDPGPLVADAVVEKLHGRAFRVRELRPDGESVALSELASGGAAAPLTVIDLDYARDSGYVVFDSRGTAGTQRITIRYTLRPAAQPAGGTSANA